MYKILITDGMDEEKVNDLRNKGFEIIDKKVDKDELMKLVKEVHIIIIRSRTQITREIIDESLKTNNLKLIIRAGVGLDNIDLEYCREKKIEVRNTPNSSSNSVAELALAQLINISRFVHSSNVTMREGKWEKKNYNGCEIFGKTLGLIGCGRIATLLGEKAKALGMNIIFYDNKYIENNAFKKVSLDELLENSDYISIHIPGNNNKNLITKDEFEKMKKGVYILNLSRGGIINEIDLINAIDKKIVAGAALDVYENEPKVYSKILENENISITPHIGAATKEAQKRIGREIEEIIMGAI